MANVLIYARVSTELQRDNTSLYSQTERCKAWCLANGHNIADVVEEVQSGKNLADREAVQRVLARVLDPASGIDGLVVMKVDRLSRSVIDILSIAKTFQEKDKLLAIVELAIDTSTPAGKLILTMLGALAELERETIAERCNLGRATARSLGRRTGGPAPYGYVTASTGTLSPDPAEQDILKHIHVLNADGYAASAIAHQLNTQDIPTKRGGVWRANTITNLLMRDEAALIANAQLHS